MQNFMAQLKEIESRYKAEKEYAENKFNIFSALHKKHDEKYLHSRFISYLLSPTSKHGMGTIFLKLFIETIAQKHSLITDFKFERCSVRPNEQEKSEYKDIDILIENDNQVIILENKIFAQDSNDTNKPLGKQIQLERYYNEIKTQNNKEIFAVYLTLDRHDPQSLDQIKFPVFKIDYRVEIINWLSKCISFIEDEFLKEILLQYKIIVIGLTNDISRAEELKTLLSKNLDESWSQRGYIFNQMGDFIHVKWHTINYFWLGLTERLETDFGIHILKNISTNKITKVAHKSRKGAFGIVFKSLKGEEWYIVNDVQNGLTCGQLMSEISDKEWFPISKDIKFSLFDNKETFDLIDELNCDRLIDNVCMILKAKLLI